MTYEKMPPSSSVVPTRAARAAACIDDHHVDFDPASAAAHGLAVCEACGLVEPIGQRRCGRCFANLHLRKPYALQRTWALMIGAALLYLPANLLPVLDVSSSVKGEQKSTIISGVIQFWQDADYPVAIIIFTASVMIPILKIISLVWLCLATTHGRRPETTTRLYRLTEFIGRWSMVDVFVVAILVGVVQLGSVMSIHPGEGAVAFAGVVILTMLAASSFDPRLIWDAAAKAERKFKRKQKQPASVPLSK